MSIKNPHEFINVQVILNILDPDHNLNQNEKIITYHDGEIRYINWHDPQLIVKLENRITDTTPGSHLFNLDANSKIL